MSNMECIAIDRDRGIVTYGIARDTRKEFRIACALFFFFMVGVFTHCGCAGGWLYDPLPGQEEAVAVAKASMGGTSWQAPKVFVRPPDMLDCDINGDGLKGWRVPDRDYCITGAYYEPSPIEGPGWIELAQRDRWAETSLAHELTHAWLYAHTGGGQANHVGPAWGADGMEGAAMRAVEQWELTFSPQNAQ